jgi:hypothetical protein
MPTDLKSRTKLADNDERQEHRVCGGYQPDRGLEPSSEVRVAIGVERESQRQSSSST